MNLRPFCGSMEENKGIKDYLLNESEWNAVSELLSILQPFKKYTTQLQAPNKTLSDFFAYWTSLRIKFENRTGELGVLIFEEMQKREQPLMENPVLLGAVYLDPRFQCVLKKEQKLLAINFLSSLYAKLKNLETAGRQQEENVRDTDTEKSNNESDSFEEVIY